MKDEGFKVKIGSSMINDINPMVVNSATVSQYGSKSPEFEEKEDDYIVTNYLHLLAQNVIDHLENPETQVKSFVSPIKRDSFWQIYNNHIQDTHQEPGTDILGGLNFEVQNSKGLIEESQDYLEQNTDPGSLLIIGDMVNITNLLSFEVQEIHHEVKKNLKESLLENKSMNPSSFVGENLVAPPSVDSSAIQSLLTIPDLPLQTDFLNYCEKNQSFKTLLEFNAEVDKPEYLISEDQWNTLDPEKQSELLSEIETFYMFLPLHHVKFDGRRDLRGENSKMHPPSNFDKAFNALVYFNKMIVQQFINETSHSIITGEMFLPFIDSPLGWLGVQKVSNLFPLNDVYRPIFISHCSNLYLLTTKIIFSKLVAISLGSWASLRLASFEDCLRSLQMGDWHFVKIKTQRELKYVEDTTKRVIGIDRHSVVWVKGPKSLTTKNDCRWKRLDLTAQVEKHHRQACISVFYLKSSGELLISRLLIPRKNVPCLIKAGIKRSEESEDQAASYLFQFKLEFASASITRLLIMDSDSNQNLSFQLLSLEDPLSETFILPWKSQRMLILQPLEGIVSLKITSSSRVDLKQVKIDSSEEELDRDFLGSLLASFKEQYESILRS